MARRASDDLMVVAEAQLNLTDDSYLLPDILVHSKAIKVPDVRGPTALLVVEIADTSLDYDLLTKAPRYAGHGVREYWVIDAQTLVTTIHRQPSGSEYARVDRLEADDRLTPEAVPQLAVTLRDLDL
jgi:Uma2 family endonuclease